MTDRHAGYIVTLERDLREDDAEAIHNALSMVKGVLTVEPVVSRPDIHIAEQRAEMRFRQRLIDALWPEDKEP